MDQYSLPQNCSFIPNHDSVLIQWKKPPKNILLVHKFCDDNVIECVRTILVYILQKWDVTIFLEPRTVAELRKDDRFIPVLDRYLTPSAVQIAESLSAPYECSGVNSVTPREAVTYSGNSTNRYGQFNENSMVKVLEGASLSEVELVICLGGDGTLLHIASMFQRVAPPVIAFRLGSLGFLTPFPFKAFPVHMRVALDGTPNCLLRMRLCCQIVRNNEQPMSGNHTASQDLSDSSQSRGSSPDTEYHVLNELVIDRGLSPFPCDLMVKVNGRKITHFEGDGLIVSTPTGSTAYSMATGASLLHPWVPAFLLTPINSFALSSRAIVLPINLRLEIAIAPGARCRAVHFSFDGRSRASNLIYEGDSIVVTSSPYPIPCLCGADQAADWFCGLNHLLNWNTRLRRDSVNLSCVEPVEHTDA